MPIATYPWYSGRPSFPQPPPRVTPSPLHCQRLESLITYCLQCDEWPGPTAAMHRNWSARKVIAARARRRFPSDDVYRRTYGGPTSHVVGTRLSVWAQ
ncbi:hypothetical protein FKP32DRAFT_650042 [Trametes sanguinea]|nr:hypothetical protein FKP32DRAFT_650042 [Trametes sanguinea]